MSMKSQQSNMRRLAGLLGQDLGYISGSRECGPNGAKQTFLHVGKVFLRALAKDLRLREYTVCSHAGGIAVSGECCLSGMWEDSGIYICLGQFTCGENVLLYRTIRNTRDYKGGYNHYLSLRDLREYPYEQVLNTLAALRKDGCKHEYAA